MGGEGICAKRWKNKGNKNGRAVNIGILLLEGEKGWDILFSPKSSYLVVEGPTALLASFVPA